MPSHAYRFAAVLVACLGLLSPVLSQSDPQTEDWSRQDQKYMERMKPNTVFCLRITSKSTSSMARRCSLLIRRLLSF